MPTRYIYTQPAAESSLSQEGGDTTRQTAASAVLTGAASAAAVGLEPGQRSLDGVYRGDDAQVLAEELRELFAAPGYGSVPIWTTDAGAEWEGYYVLETLSTEPVEPQAQDVLQRYRGVVKEQGSRRSHWRSVGTSQKSRTNDFGSDQTVEIGVDADASMVRWWDGDAATEFPSPVATRTTEKGDVEVYDVTAASYSEPTLLFDIAYDAEWETDCVVWDTLGLADKVDADGDTQWRRVFAPGHDEAGEFVFSNRLLRLFVDDDAETISAERWDSGSSAYASVSLGASSWAPVDVDVRTIAPARLEARILFSDGSNRYPLDVVLSRGDTDALWVRTPNAGSATPSGLVDLLDPVAQTTIYDAGAEQGLVDRTEVDQ